MAEPGYEPRLPVSPARALNHSPLPVGLSLYSGSGKRQLGVWLGSATHQPCELRQMALPLDASVSSSVK